MMCLQQMLTIEEYLEMVRPIDNTPFRNVAKEPEPIVANSFQQMLTEFIADNYSTYHLRSRFFGTEPEMIAGKVQSACDNVYLTHAYTYQHMYDTTIAVYNPIENYDMVEHEEIANSGEDTTTTNKGAQQDKTTTSIGSKTDQMMYGDSKDTNTYGARSTTTDTTGDVAPFESQSYQHVDKGHQTVGEASVTDTLQHSQRVDTQSLGGRQDSTTTDQGKRTDTETLEHGHEITRDLTRHGNIGVTTSQQMLQSERELAQFNLVRIVANDIIHTICVCVEGV